MEFKKVGLSKENEQSKLGVQEFNTPKVSRENLVAANAAEINRQTSEAGSLERLQIQRANLEERLGLVDEKYDPRNVVQKLLGLTENQGLILGTLDLLNRPLGVVKGLANQGFNDTEDGNIGEALWTGIKGDNRDLSWTEVTGADVGTFGNFVMNLGMDIALDPLMYVAPGTFVKAIKGVPGVVPGFQTLKQSEFGQAMGRAGIKLKNELGKRFQFMYGSTDALKQTALELTNDANTLHKNALVIGNEAKRLSQDLAPRLQKYLEKNELDPGLVKSLKNTKKNLDGTINTQSAKFQMDEFLDDLGIFDVAKKYEKFKKEANFGAELTDPEMFVKFIKGNQQLEMRALKILRGKDETLITKLNGIDNNKFKELLKLNKNEILEVMAKESSSYLGAKGLDNLTDAIQSYFFRSTRDGFGTGEIGETTLENLFRALGSPQGAMIPTEDIESIIPMLQEMVAKINNFGGQGGKHTMPSADELKKLLAIRQEPDVPMLRIKETIEKLSTENKTQIQKLKESNEKLIKSGNANVKQFDKTNTNIEQIDKMLLDDSLNLTKKQKDYLTNVKKSKQLLEQQKVLQEQIRMDTRELTNYLENKYKVQDGWDSGDLKLLENLLGKKGDALKQGVKDGSVWELLNYEYDNVWKLNKNEQAKFDLLANKKSLTTEETKELKILKNKKEALEETEKLRPILNSNRSEYRQFQASVNALFYKDQNIKRIKDLLNKTSTPGAVQNIEIKSLSESLIKKQKEFNGLKELADDTQKGMSGIKNSIKYKNLEKDIKELTKKFTELNINPNSVISSENIFEKIIKQKTGVIDWSQNKEALSFIEEYARGSSRLENLDVKSTIYHDRLKALVDEIKSTFATARDIYKESPNKEIFGTNSFISDGGAFWESVLERNLNEKFNAFKTKYKGSAEKHERELYNKISNIVKKNSKLSLTKVTKTQSHAARSTIKDALISYENQQGMLRELRSSANAGSTSLANISDVLTETATKLKDKNITKRVEKINNLKQSRKLDNDIKKTIDERIKAAEKIGDDVKYYGGNSDIIRKNDKKIIQLNEKFKRTQNELTVEYNKLEASRPKAYGLDGSVWKNDADAMFYITHNQNYGMDSLQDLYTNKERYLANGMTQKQFENLENFYGSSVGKGITVKFNPNYKAFKDIDTGSNQVYSSAILGELRSKWKEMGDIEWNSAKALNDSLRGTDEFMEGTIKGQKAFTEKFIGAQEYAWGQQKIQLPQDVLKPKQFTNEKFVAQYDMLMSELRRFTEKHNINPDLLFNSVYFKNIQNGDELLGMVANYNKVTKTPNAGSIKAGSDTPNKLRGLLPGKTSAQENIFSGETLNAMMGIDIYEANRLKVMMYNLSILPEELSFSTMIRKALKTGDIRAIDQAEWIVQSTKGEKLLAKKGKMFVSTEELSKKMENWRDLVPAAEHEEFFEMVRPVLEGAGQDNIIQTAQSKTFRTNNIEVSIGLWDFLSKPERTPGIMSELSTALGRFLKPWKATLLLTPGYHFRNFVSNFLNANVAGVGVADYARHYTQASTEIAEVHKMTRSMTQLMTENIDKYNKFEKQIDLDNFMFEVVAKKDNKKFSLWKEYQQLASEGVTGQSKVQSDFWDYQKDLSKISKNKNWTQEKIQKVFDTNMFVGQYTEDISRLALYRAAKENPALYTNLGLDSPQKFVSFTLFDYGALTEFEKGIARNWIPFYTWSRKNLEFQMKMLLIKPDKLTRVGKALNAAYDSQGIDKSEMPDWIENNMWFPVKYTKDDGTEAVRFLKANPPIQDFVDLGNLKLLSRVNPPFKVLLEGLTGQDMFSQKNTNFTKSAYNSFLTPFTKAIAQPFDVPIGAIPLGDNFKLGQLVGQDIDFGSKNSIWFSQDVEKLRKSYYWEQINGMTSYINYLKKLGTDIPSIAEFRKRELSRKSFVKPPIKNYQIKKNFK